MVVKDLEWRSFSGNSSDFHFKTLSPKGYGARWEVQRGTNELNVSFRGFLEPTRPGGHEAGWVH